jgi:Flp pilus assembly pilin Flp
MFIAAVVSALLVGYLGGLLSFKVKTRWCPRCGALTSQANPDQVRRTL